MFQPGGAGGYFVPTMPQPQRFYGPAQMAQIRATPRWPAQPQVRPNAQGGASGFPNMQAPFRTAPRAPGAQPGSMRNALSARPITGTKKIKCSYKCLLLPLLKIFYAVYKPENFMTRVVSKSVLSAPLSSLHG